MQNTDRRPRAPIPAVGPVRSGPKHHNAVHGAKRQFLGNGAKQVPPAWRSSNVPTGPAKASDGPRRILISQLPFDVSEQEVEELFQKTVGPLREAFLVYNSIGGSKGMAIVTFQRPGDALVARSKYHGKIVDGRKPVKIEILVDKDLSAQSLPPKPLSLLSRIAPAPASSASNGVQTATSKPSKPLRVTHVAASHPVAVPPRVRQKKGPKRLKKRQPATVADLDKEMEDYRAAAPEVPFS